VVLGGLGVRGRHWLRVLLAGEGCAVAALVDPKPENLARAQAEAPEAAAFADLEQALEAVRADTLVLATPPDGHRAQAQAAFARGLPLLCEKPLTLDLAEAVAIVREAEQAQGRLTVGLNFRYLGVTKALCALLQEGRFGSPAFSLFSYLRQRDGRAPNLNKYPLTMDQPMLWEQSIHHFDLMRFCYQAEVRSVQASTWNPPWSMYRDDSNVAAILEFENGIVVNYLGTWQAGWDAQFDFKWRTDCTEGVIVQRHQFGELLAARRDAPALEAVPLPPHVDWITDTSGLWQAFAAAVRAGGPMPCSGQDHLKSLALVVACIESSTGGGRVDMKELYTRHGIPAAWW
jgi:predicted dehydrogenase